MERAIWKLMCFLVLLLFVEVCMGLPINQDYSYRDDHTQFLTGLIAILLTICGIVCLAGCLCCQKKNGFKDKQEEKCDEEFQNAVVVESVPNNVEHGHINPLSSPTTNFRNEFTIFNPLTVESPGQRNVFSEQNSIVYSSGDWKYEDKDVRAWFNNGEVEFPRTKLKYIRELGKGWFGRVVEGTAQGLDAKDKNAWKPVVVRILEASASLRQRILFLHDASIYRCLPHPNILLLLGRSLDNVPLLLLQEYTDKGDLKSFLRKQGSNVNSDLSLRWCYQLTSALKHLHSSNVVHSDLATRNCRLAENMDLKLGDYGCSTTDYPEDYYHGSESVPIRWCAPEIITFTSTTLQTKSVTESSNIWSLGVCFWEIYECGTQPYSELNDDEVVTQVLGPPHIRLSKPKINVDLTNYMYRLMQLCWSTCEFRPTITEVYLMLEDLVQLDNNTAYSMPISDTDFDARWNKLKPNMPADASLTSWERSLDSTFTRRASSLDNLEQASSWRADCANDTDLNLSVSDETNETKEPISFDFKEFKTSEPLKFQLGAIDKLLARSSSESETEDENWKRKVECGLYTEKVRQKSRSVANLMILTHIDCSESESETPLTSLSYKSGRYGEPKQPFENAGLSFGSEGNLLSVQNDFEEELRKLRDELREQVSLVPDKNSIVPQQQQAPPPTTKLMEDLNSSATIEPPNQIFNVYNVMTISPPGFSPVHAAELKKIINYNDDVEKPLIATTKREIPKLSEIIENNIELMDYIIAKYDPEDELLDAGVSAEKDLIVPENNALDKSDLAVAQALKQNVVETELVKGESSESDEYVTANTHTVSDTTESTISGQKLISSQPQTGTLNEENISESDEYFTLMSQQNSVSGDEATEADLTYCCEPINDSVNSNQVSKDIVPNDTYDNLVQINNEIPMSSVEELHHTQIQTLQSILTDHSSSESTLCNMQSDNTITKTQDFLNNEILTYEDSNEIIGDDKSPELSRQIANGTLDFETFSSTPLKTRDSENSRANLNYSLENWDNFLGKSFDEQHEFDEFADQPMSLLFTEDQTFEQNDSIPTCNTNEAAVDATFVKSETSMPETSKTKSLVAETATLDITYNVEDDFQNSSEISNKLDATFVRDVSPDEIYLQMEDGNECYENPGYWEAQNSGGWYLHPQGDTEEELQGDMDLSQEDDSYVRFNVDDEVMAAIRSELMLKLPHAQKPSSDQNDDFHGEYETTDRHEVFLRYYNAPLSPIPEESYSELLNSGQSTPHCTINTELNGSDSDSDWSEAGLGANSLEEDTHSPRLMDSPLKTAPHRHTPSQDSCCSNDTLFNLEELQYNEKQLQDVEESKRRSEETAHLVNDIVKSIIKDALLICSSTAERKTSFDTETMPATPSESDNIDSLPSSVDVTVIQLENQLQEQVMANELPLVPKLVVQEFIDMERTASLDVVLNAKEPPPKTEDPKLLAPQEPVCFMLQHIAPLNSPEDRPWKHIEASLTKCPDFSEYPESQGNSIYEYVDLDAKQNKVIANDIEADYEKEMNLKNALSSRQTDLYDCIEGEACDNHVYENESYEVPIYANSEIKDHMYENLEHKEAETEYANVNGCHSFNYNDSYCPLEDIRFTGPENGQMMITSFSESNEDHEWDSGSDSRSSSSGEFIWKEGEHESSVKALQAPPQEESLSAAAASKDDEETSSCSDEDLDGIEFVPSAWDKFATPSKSAMRSPEKSLDRNMKKNRGVSFKKQKYHCVYEYPREPETTVIQNYELWKNQSYIDWDLDRSSDPYLPGSSDYHETASSSDISLTQNQHVNYDFTGSYPLDDDFYISSSTKPFDILEAATSQFFPGKHCEWSELIKNNDNVTPDSGVEDITPGSLSDSSDYVRPNRQILPLKTLAQLAVNKNVNVGSNEIGGLRHTKNRLKLDLPPSPNAFTKSKNIVFDSPNEHSILPCQIPTFTTFGKSRFFVQQVDTSADDESSKRNVSFEALPYKPMSKQFMKGKRNDRADKSRIEIVRGEASLLDSADEDSGIESSTLERKNASEVSSD